MDLIRLHLWKKKEQWQRTVLTMILVRKSTQPFGCIFFKFVVTCAKTYEIYICS